MPNIAKVQPAHPMRGVAIEPVELIAGGFLLRPPRVGEALDVLRLARDPDVRMWNPRCQIDDEQAAIADCIAGADWSGGTQVTLSIVDQSTGTYAGTIALNDIDPNTGQARIGYRVAPWTRGRGVATASLTTLSAWALVALGLHRIALTHAVENLASCRVADKSGFALAEVLTASKRFGDGHLHDEHLHQLTRPELRGPMGD